MDWLGNKSTWAVLLRAWTPVSVLQLVESLTGLTGARECQMADSRAPCQLISPVVSVQDLTCTVTSSLL